MAWLSVGTSNDDLVDKLVMNSILKEGPILQAFRCVDRGDFVPEEDRAQAYLDRPFKRGPVHLSAPHMYATVLEALQLQPGLAFLNVGSGSGYLSCLASCLLGEEGLSHGVELNPSLVVFSRERIARFAEKNRHSLTCEPATITEGNCFSLDVSHCSRVCRYDRVYVGAGCPEGRKEFFFDLLAEGGTLVMPVTERSQLLKVTKLAGRVFSETVLSNVHFAPLAEEEGEGETGHPLPIPDPTIAAFEAALLPLDASQLVIHHRHPSPPLPLPSATHRVRLPPLVWQPIRSRHRQFPRDFREVVKMILMASNRCAYARPFAKYSPKCLCSVLPTFIWFHIFTFTSRDWFVPVRSELQVVRFELIAERKLRREAEQRAVKAEAARRAAERERDLLRALLMKSNQQPGQNKHPHHLFDLDEDDEEDDELLEESDGEEQLIGENEDDDGEEEEEEENAEGGEEVVEEVEEMAGDGDNLPLSGENDTPNQPANHSNHLPEFSQLPIFPSDLSSAGFLFSTSLGSNTTAESNLSEEMEIGSERNSFASDSSQENSHFDEPDHLDTEEHFPSDD